MLTIQYVLFNLINWIILQDYKNKSGSVVFQFFLEKNLFYILIYYNMFNANIIQTFSIQKSILYM